MQGGRLSTTVAPVEGRLLLRAVWRRTYAVLQRSGRSRSLWRRRRRHSCSSTMGGAGASAAVSSAPSLVTIQASGIASGGPGLIKGRTAATVTADGDALPVSTSAPSF